MMTTEAKQDLLKRGWTRRNFGRISSLLAAGGAMPFYNEAALAQLSAIGPLPSGAVKINANENPLGPCKEAAEAIHKVVGLGGRYMYEETFTLASILAELEGVKPSNVMPFGGSSDPLHRAVLAYTSPTKSLVMADPGYEAGQRAAQFIGAKVHRIPLTKAYRHDVKAMAAADVNAGVLYVCNPNNPTGTITPKEDIDWLVANKPAGSILLLDEAYIHLSKSATPGSYLVAQDKDVVILRTFSKLYGMAGLRAGAAIGRADLIEKLRS
ncbi:MAG TPA: aminotransferase class I/II-fold pyridoxal phosphate-dependent enzyme, partial [Bryobacteraceae bacterium]|nr:aminotransferase class I/II-fold pyridoxal phosphate-dependent enzyme [Bryobacteraceae bacterium]